jgi:hypothetical protein
VEGHQIINHQSSTINHPAQSLQPAEPARPVGARVRQNAQQDPAAMFVTQGPFPQTVASEAPEPASGHDAKTQPTGLPCGGMRAMFSKTHVGRR